MCREVNELPPQMLCKALSIIIINACRHYVLRKTTAGALRGNEDYRRLGKLAAGFQRLIQRLIKSKREHLMEWQSKERFYLVKKWFPVASSVEALEITVPSG